MAVRHPRQEELAQARDPYVPTHRRARRRRLQTAVAIPAIVAIGAGALAGCASEDAAADPALTASSTPAATPTHTVGEEPPVTDAVTAVHDTERDWFRVGGQVPVDAPFETFPVSTEPVDPEQFACTPEQMAWLLEHGVAGTEGDSWDELEPQVAGPTEFVPLLEYQLTSSAPTAVTLQNLRVEGSSVEAPARVEFHCVHGGIGGYLAPYYAVAAVGSDSPATYAAHPDAGDSYEPDELAPAAPGSPFATDLAPGGTSRLDLLLTGIDPGRDFRGRVVADAVIDGVTHRAVLDDDVRVPGPASVQTVHALAGYGRLYCLPEADLVGYFTATGSVDELAPYECTPQELAEQVRAASGS